MNLKIKSDLTWPRTWHRTGKGAPGVKLFLNVPGPPGSQLKINVHFQHFTKREKNSQSRVRNAQVSLDLSVISDSVEEQTDFSCFLSPVVPLNRPRSL